MTRFQMLGFEHTVEIFGWFDGRIPASQGGEE